MVFQKAYFNNEIEKFRQYTKQSKEWCAKHAKYLIFRGERKT